MRFRSTLTTHRIFIVFICLAIFGIFYLVVKDLNPILFLRVFALNFMLGVSNVYRLSRNFLVKACRPFIIFTKRKKRRVRFV